MRDEHEQFTRRGIDLVVVGMGATETARRFKADYRLPFPVLVDKKKESYRLLGLKRGSFSEVMGPSVWVKGVKSLMKNGQGLPQEDPYQLGGAAVIADGVVKFLHRSKTSADNASVEALLEVV